MIILTKCHLRQDLDQAAGKSFIFSRLKKWSSFPFVSNSARATNSMHILLDILRQIKVDDMFYIRDIKSPSRHRRRHENWSPAGSEVTKGCFTLLLSSIAIREKKRLRLFL